MTGLAEAEVSARADRGIVDRAVGLLRTAEGRKFVKYFLASVITTILSLSLIWLFYDKLQLASAGWCAFAANTIAIPPSYYLNRAWAWGKTGKSHVWKEIVPFWVIALTGLGLSTLASIGAEHVARHLSHSHQVATVMVQAANLGTYVVLWLLRFFILNRFLFIDHSTADEE